MANKVCGVYLIIGWSSGVHYVGSSTDFANRRKWQRWCLKRGYHVYQQEFEQSFKDDSLTFFLLQQYPSSTNRKDLNVYEQEWADHFPHRVNRFKNVTGKGDHRKPLSSDHVEKIRRAMLGKKYALGSGGWHHTAEVKERIRQLAMGNKRGLGNKSKTGQKLSAKTIVKMKKAQQLRRRAEQGTP